MSKGTHWTDTEIANLSKLSRAHTVLELTHLLKRSDASVRRRLEEMGMSAVPAPRARRDADGLDLKTRIAALCDQGKRPVEIARILNANVDYVSMCARIHNGTGEGVGAMTRRPERDRRHLLAIAKASKGKGFPYCLGRTA